MAGVPDSLEALRERLAGCMRRIYNLGLTTSSGGNLSARDAEGRVWVTPARLDKGALAADDLVAVTLDGDVVAGHRPPTSEIHFHLATYRNRPDIHALVHAHPVGLVAYSAANATPPTQLLGYAKEVCGEVQLAPYAPPGTADLGQQVAAAFGTDRLSVVLAKHGTVVGGPTLEAAFARFEALELAARTLLCALRLGPLPTDSPRLLPTATSAATESPSGGNAAERRRVVWLAGTGLSSAADLRRDRRVFRPVW